MPKRMGLRFAVYELSPAEKWLCDGLVSGSSYKELATQFDLSQNTVRTLAKRAMTKLGLGEREQERLVVIYQAAEAFASMLSPHQASSTGNGYTISTSTTPMPYALGVASSP